MSWERAEREAADGRLTETRAREIISETVRRATGKPLEFAGTRTWCNDWLKDKIDLGDLAENSKFSYNHAIKLFLEHLGDKADQNIAHVNSADIQSFKLSRVAAALSAKTIDRDLKVIRSVFKAARARGVISFDPTQAISLLSKKSKRKSQVVIREIFSSKELDDILAQADGEWKTAIMLARYLGARQGDCKVMTWANVDLSEKLVRYSDAKTQKEYKVPIHSRLEKHFMELAGSDDPNGLLCPELSKKTSGGKYGLSSEFRKIMAKAKVDDLRVKTKAVKAEEGKGRLLSRRSFHSIRHSYNSELANAGTSQEIRRKLVGHSSDNVNDVYTHLDIKLFRKAIRKLA